MVHSCDIVCHKFQFIRDRGHVALLSGPIVHLLTMSMSGQGMMDYCLFKPLYSGNYVSF